MCRVSLLLRSLWLELHAEHRHCCRFDGIERLMVICGKEMHVEKNEPKKKEKTLENEREIERESERE